MEENNKSIKSRRSVNKSFGSKSVFASLALAVVAVVAVVMLGFNPSYAQDNVSNDLPDTFTTAQVSTEIYFAGASITNPVEPFVVSPYYTTDDIQVFCLEHNVPFLANTEFNKGDAITDYGLLYLMANIYPNVEFDTFLSPELQTWLSQVTVWMYLYEKELIMNGSVPNTSNNYISDEHIQIIKTTRGVTGDDISIIYTGNPNTNGISNGVVDYTNDPILYDKYIKPLVDAALSYNANPSSKTVYINFDEEIAITQDEKYYQTSEVTVTGTPAGNFRGYELVINAAPEGTFVVDANGNKIEDLKNMSVTDKFYFRIPVDKLTEENKILKFSVNATFRDYIGNYYVDATGQAQKITSVSTEDTVVSDGDEISIVYSPRVPDTGMSTAQTVYFIGLIILLSGVGIIYANVKPEESK